jgi:hypothetical protein
MLGATMIAKMMFAVPDVRSARDVCPMTSPATPPNDPRQPRDAAYWAEPVAALKVGAVPAGALNLNVDGRRVVGPLQGFCPLWQKTYRVRLAGSSATPAEVILVWKERFAALQPPHNRLYGMGAAARPGEIVLMNADMRCLPVNSGLLIPYADDEAFTLMTPEGCPEAGWIMCSAFVEDGATVAQIQTQGRSNDPIFEFGFRFLAGAKEQEKIWSHVLTELAALFGVRDAVNLRKVCLDPRIQWSRVGNVWGNATVRSVLYLMTHPGTLARRSTECAG